MDLNILEEECLLLVQKVVGLNPGHAEVQPTAILPLEKAALQ